MTKKYPKVANDEWTIDLNNPADAKYFTEVEEPEGTTTIEITGEGGAKWMTHETKDGYKLQFLVSEERQATFHEECADLDCAFTPKDKSKGEQSDKE